MMKQPYRLPQDSTQERGSALIASLIIAALLSTLMAGYFLLTGVEMRTTHDSIKRTNGFYAAEAGLNLRAEDIRQRFLGFNRPAGVSPVVNPGSLPCQVDQGSGDFRCQTYSFRGRQVWTYVTEVPGNPTIIVIPPGETYQNLNAQEYNYIVSSVSVNSDNEVEAVLEMEFQSRVVPLFQFAVFFNKDLEITPGPALTFSGPIHTNFDLYAAANTTVDITGDVTVAGDLYRGRKEGNICWTGPFRIMDPVTPRNLPDCAGVRRLITSAEVAPWNGHVEIGVDQVVVPQPDILDATPGATYWDNADIRIMYDVDTGSIDAYAADGNLHAANADLAGANCAGATGSSTSFYNNREGGTIQMLEIDMQDLLNCMQRVPALIDGKLLSDDTHGGLVAYLGVTGLDEAGQNLYGVRVQNGETLASTVGGAPAINGLTVASNQAMYIEGHYNRTDKKPAAFLADSMNVLSTDWNDSKDTQYYWYRYADPTTINAAFLAGSDTTGGAEGPPGQDIGNYSGGVHNFKRMHENWYNTTLTYRGSLVSLAQPQHVDGGLIVGSPQYSPPIRDFNYDTDFNNMANLPPLTPQFVYLKMNVFVRDYGL